MEVDTIAAIVTPPGEGGVGIIRLSGPRAAEVGSRLFPHVRGRWQSHRLRQGELIDPGDAHVIDEALGCLMPGPRSYTGEDVFEIHCHGSPLVLETVLRSCFASGCRAAKPGEFTLRAFLNGRLDLSRAEAVIDVVRARSNLALDLAVNQLRGNLAHRVGPLREVLLGVLAHMEAMVDFVEEDVPPEMDDHSRHLLETASGEIDMLLEGSKQGILLREGATLTIVGSPNVGKSSIMNGLLGADRSIVTAIAGTTRDTVEETLQIRGIPFRTVDTAGITETEDVVERIGVARSREALRLADVVVLVIDRSREIQSEDVVVADIVREALLDRQRNGEGPRLVVALNKSDLPTRCADVPAELDADELVETSAVRPAGLEGLRSALERVALGDRRHEVVVGNVRHQEALRRASTCLRSALDGLDSGVPLDLASFDVRASLQALGEITGANVDDELLDRIFRDFCIGK